MPHGGGASTVQVKLMALVTRRLDFTAAERAAIDRTNAALALAPRLKVDGWRLTAGQWLNARVTPAAERVTQAWLARRGVTVEVLRIPNGEVMVPLRILRPVGPARGVALDIHGGGWVVGSAGLNDRLNAHLVAEAGLAVVSVDYRLLNEPKGVLLPHAVSDCVAAARWLVEHAVEQFGTDRLLLVGESAGGHLAALTALELRTAHRLTPFMGCVFVYGVFDLTGTPSVRSAGPETLLLNGPTMAADLARLTPGLDEDRRRRPDISPLHADLGGMPPALFVVGELDPLLDDSRLMAAAWAEAAPAELVEVPASPHGFMHFGGPGAASARVAIRDWLTPIFGGYAPGPDGL